MSQELDYRKCKDCDKTKVRMRDGRYPNSKDTRYIDDTGKEWNGNRCPSCHKHRCTQRKRNNSRLIKLTKELANVE